MAKILIVEDERSVRQALRFELEDEGFEVKLSHPLKTKAIAYAKVKTDKVDSATLAHLLRSNLLPLSYVPEKPVRLNRELLRYRASLVRIQSFVLSLWEPVFKQQPW